MANRDFDTIESIEGLIKRAQDSEISDPGKAHARYEVAERSLDTYLVVNYHIARDSLAKYPDHPLSVKFLPYFDTIIKGYGRLEENKKRTLD